MKNHVKVKINGILNNSLFKITMIILCCLILSTSIIRTDNFINCMFNGLVIFALLINIYHLPIVLSSRATEEVQKEMWIYNIINSMHCFWFLVLFSNWWISRFYDHLYFLLFDYMGYIKYL